MKLSPHFIERGYELQEQTLSDIKQAQESGIWKGYTNYEPEGIKTLTPQMVMTFTKESKNST